MKGKIGTSTGTVLVFNRPPSRKIARQKAARKKLKAQAQDNLDHDRKRYEERLTKPWPLVKRTPVVGE